MLLSPTPKLDDKEKNDKSFLFSGDVQTAGQGIGVPLTYGQDRVRPIPVATIVVTNQITVPGGIGSFFKGEGSDTETDYTGDGGTGDNTGRKGGSGDSDAGGYDGNTSTTSPGDTIDGFTRRFISDTQYQ
jgi:hypothetical protein